MTVCDFVEKFFFFGEFVEKKFENNNISQNKINLHLEELNLDLFFFGENSYEG